MTPTSPYAGRSILVVGGAGFVGRNLVSALHEAGADRILVVDNLLSADRSEALDLPSVEFVEASITENRVLDALPRALDHVFHLATYHGNQSSMADPLADHENNLLTTLKLFDRLSRRGDLGSVVYASAGCTVAEKTYGEPKPSEEDDPVSLHLDSPYQISKVVGEMYANYYFARHRLPVVSARFQNVYGPGEMLGAGRWRGTPATVWRNVTPTFIYRALSGLPLQLENGGIATRDFIFVGDIVRGLMLCGSAGRAGEVYNLASGVETTIRGLAETIADAVGGSVALEIAPERSWDRSGRRLGSTRKAHAELGFEARVPIEQGIATTVAWTQANLDRINAAIARHEPHMAVAAGR